MDTLSLTKETRIYSGEKTISLTSGAGKTGQPLVKECTGTTQRDGTEREECSGWGTRVYLWRIHVDIWQNQYNIVKLKNKINLKKK